jgi:hypothetical protein
MCSSFPDEDMLFLNTVTFPRAPFSLFAAWRGASLSSSPSHVSIDLPLNNSCWMYYPLPEAEFLDVIGTKVLRNFLLVIHNQLPPLEQKWLEIWIVNIVYRNLKF